MSSHENSEREPFLIPFLVALVAGVPIAGLSYGVAMGAGWLATAITVLLGLACGYGAGKAAPCSHPAGAAVIATLVLIILAISTITLRLIADELGQPLVVTFLTLLREQDIVGFANQCVDVAGRTVPGYPLGLYAAYRVSDL